MDEHPASFDSNSSEASPDASLDANAQVWSAKIQAAATDRQTDATDRQTEAQLKAAEITAGATDRQTVVQTVAMVAFSLFGIGWTELKALLLGDSAPFVLAVLLISMIWKRELLWDVCKEITLSLRAIIAPLWPPRGEIVENKTTIDRAASMGTLTSHGMIVTSISRIRMELRMNFPMLQLQSYRLIHKATLLYKVDMRLKT